MRRVGRAAWPGRCRRCPLTSVERRLAQQPLDVRAAEEAAGRRACGGAADEHLRGQRGREVGVADQGQRLGDRRVGQQDRPARRSSGRRRCSRRSVISRRTGAASSGSISSSSRSWSAAGISPSRSAASSSSIASSTSAARSSPSVREQVDLVVLGQLLEDVGEPLVVERVDDLVPPLVRHLLQRRGDVGGAHGLAASTSSASVPWPARSSVSPSTSSHARPGRAARAGPAGRAARAPRAADHPVAGAGLLHRGVDDDGVRAAVVAGRQPHRCGRAARPTTSTSLGRCSNRFMLTVPDGQHDRVGLDARDPPHRHEDPPPRPAARRPGRARAAAARSTRRLVTASRTRPSWSPSGSKTPMPASRATNTRVAVLTSRA